MNKERGFALILTLISLSVLTLLGLSLSFNALTDKRIANNHEAEILAHQLAEAGLNRALLELRGKAFNTIVVGGTTYTQVLIGPNNQQDTPTSTVTANAFDFRNPIPSRGLSVVDPRLVDINNLTQLTSATINDDGVISAIGQTGVGYYVSPGNDGIFGTSDDIGFFDNTRLPTARDRLVGRYLVKVTNNPEDPGGPFKDTDYILVVRSTGIAKSMPGETALGSGGPATNIRNAVVTMEARIRLDTTFQTNSPFTVQGTNVVPFGNRFFDGTTYSIDGGNYLGMSIIDAWQPYITDPVADPMVHDVCGARFSGNTVGANVQNGAPCDPPGKDKASIRNITGNILNGQTWNGIPNPDVTNVLDPAYVGNFVFAKVPGFSDQVYNGVTGCEAFQGDLNDPRLVYVCGDLTCSGNASGAGLMVVTGSVVLKGNLSYSGIILAIGAGSVEVKGNPRISGGIWASNIRCLPGGVCGTGQGCAFGQAKFSLRGTLGGVGHTDHSNMGLSLLPFNVLGYRRIQDEMDHP